MVSFGMKHKKKLSEKIIDLIAILIILGVPILLIGSLVRGFILAMLGVPSESY